MNKLTRRQLLKLGAGASTGLVLTGCQTWLKRLAALEPTPRATLDVPPSPTPRPTATMAAPTPTPPPTATVDSPLPTPQLTTVTDSSTSPLPTPTTARSTSAVKPAPPPIVLKAPAGGSKLGLHVTFGPRNGLDDFLAKCAQADRPVAVVKCVDDFEAAFKAKKVSDKTLTVGRVNAVGLNNKDFVDMQAWEPAEFNPPNEFPYKTAQEAAQMYYDLVKPTWKLNPVIDVWEAFNEFSWHWGWQADFYITLMDLAEADGYRIGLWSTSAGNPPEEFYPDIVRTCQRARTHGNHILCLHEYGLAGLLKNAPKSLVTRYRQLYKVLKQNDAVVPLVISEAGENAGGGFTGTDVFMDDFAWYDRQLSKDDYVIGCAAWTLGDWSGANFQAALPALADYISGEGYVIGSSMPYHLHVPFIVNGQGQ
jgi:hypothetical protein